MQAGAVFSPLQNPNLKPFHCYFSTFFNKPPPAPSLSLPCSHTSHFPPKYHFNCFSRNCIAPSQEASHFSTEITKQNGGFENTISSNSMSNQEEKKLENQSLWNQMKEIIMFTGPATGLWICGPLMSLIDTAVIGQGSSVELAALGPGTVLCDYMSYVFMFLSVSTSNMVATSHAREDKNEVQHQISILLFVGLTGGFFMLFFTKFFGSWALTAFTGSNNAHIVPAANTYVQIRGLAWPAVLVGWVAQSASLGMKDSWGPLKALAVASAVNGVGDIVLCSLLGYGIAGAAWATMVSQVAFYALIIYFATNMGTHTVAAHQVMIQTYCMCTVWGEPLSQTAQSFMPELLYGINRNLPKKCINLCSLDTDLSVRCQAGSNAAEVTLVTIGASLGLLLGIVGTSVPWLFPSIFTSDQKVIQEMHKVLAPYFIALAVTPATHSLEGTLLAGRDLKLVSLSMSGCFSLGAIVLLLVSSGRYALPGCWYARLGFQWARFFLSLQRLLSPRSVLHSRDFNKYNKQEKLKAD
ncbi:hypothetical protein DITRI_Ditri01bG0044900 [Diplodiscus trichospermus]